MRVCNKDLDVIREECSFLGLGLNESKSEVVCVDPVVRDLVVAGKSVGALCHFVHMGYLFLVPSYSG